MVPWVVGVIPIQPINIDILVMMCDYIPPPSGDYRIRTALDSESELGSYLIWSVTSVPSNPSAP